MKQQPAPEYLRKAFEYLRATVQRGQPWPARLEELPPDSARLVAVHAVARAMARRAPTTPLATGPAPAAPKPASTTAAPLPRYDAKRAAANDRDDDDAP